MTTFIQMVINGLALGSVYALMALGFTIIFRAAGTMNFAQGSVMMLGGLLVVRLHDALGFWGALVVAAAITAVFSVLEALLLRAAKRRDLASGEEWLMAPGQRVAAIEFSPTGRWMATGRQFENESDLLA